MTNFNRNGIAGPQVMPVLNVVTYCLIALQNVAPISVQPTRSKSAPVPTFLSTGHLLRLKSYLRSQTDVSLSYKQN